VEGVACREVDTFLYRASFENGLVEYEFDHVFVGEYDSALTPDASEVSEIKWIDVDDLVAQLTERPQDFTAWCPAVTALALRALA
jgi:isopentenyl-diphosphate delta-isomerase